MCRRRDLPGTRSGASGWASSMWPAARWCGVRTTRTSLGLQSKRARDNGGGLAGRGGGVKNTSAGGGRAPEGEIIRLARIGVVGGARAVGHARLHERNLRAKLREGIGARIGESFASGDERAVVKRGHARLRLDRKSVV